MRIQEDIFESATRRHRRHRMLRTLAAIIAMLGESARGNGNH